ncbi:HAD-IIA family hydrolase [Desulfurobacterium atlanticum]|uniref:4-nitrophenyl phosphatase n=1 Tax=Desulfurobacterium atlanticum TaxID=240169 RepID=A0A238YK60_9BACT|nr:HAD-IIA family hydrolase [Desulfurobacterium atlanticum]SNR71013.1 4-nitrophenyl phosphatase [Desulfurobacterium atlanticum]
MQIGFLLDLEGTLVKDKSYTPFPEALDFTEKLDKLGIPWIVATNNSTEKPYELINILKNKGFNVNEGKLLSPSFMAVEILKKENIKSIYFLGTEKIKEFFIENGIAVEDDYKVDAVVVGRDKAVDFKKLKTATSALVINKAKLFSYHMNRIILDKDGLVSPSVGAIATCLSYAGNCNITSFGKPSKLYFDKAFEMLGIKNPENVFMVSDDPFSDLAGGKKAVGFKTVFVLSGKYKSPDILETIEPHLRPDFIFNNIGECEKLIEANE